MRDLIVVGFPGTHRAAQVLSQVLDLNADWAADLYVKDGVAVYRTEDGRLRMDQSVQPTTKDGVAWGGAMGALIGSLLAVPLTAAFVRQVAEMVQPGQSALFLVGDTEKRAEVLEHFHGFGGTILRSTLPPEQATRLQQATNADRPVTR
jgi:uncharacterized membrane protein